MQFNNTGRCNSGCCGELGGGRVLSQISLRVIDRKRLLRRLAAVLGGRIERRFHILAHQRKFGRRFARCRRLFVIRHRPIRRRCDRVVRGFG